MPTRTLRLKLTGAQYDEVVRALDTLDGEYRYYEARYSEPHPGMAPLTKAAEKFRAAWKSRNR